MNDSAIKTNLRKLVASMHNEQQLPTVVVPHEDPVQQRALPVVAQVRDADLVTRAARAVQDNLAAELQKRQATFDGVRELLGQIHHHSALRQHLQVQKYSLQLARLDNQMILVMTQNGLEARHPDGPNGKRRTPVVLDNRVGFLPKKRLALRALRNDWPSSVDHAALAAHVEAELRHAHDQGSKLLGVELPAAKAPTAPKKLGASAPALAIQRHNSFASCIEVFRELLGCNGAPGNADFLFLLERWGGVRFDIKAADSDAIDLASDGLGRIFQGKREKVCLHFDWRKALYSLRQRSYLNLKEGWPAEVDAAYIQKTIRETWQPFRVYAPELEGKNFAAALAHVAEKERAIETEAAARLVEIAQDPHLRTWLKRGGQWPDLVTVTLKNSMYYLRLSGRSALRLSRLHDGLVKPLNFSRPIGARSAERTTLAQICNAATIEDRITDILGRSRQALATHMARRKTELEALGAWLTATKENKNLRPIFDAGPIRLVQENNPLAVHDPSGLTPWKLVDLHLEKSQIRGVAHYESNGQACEHHIVVRFADNDARFLDFAWPSGLDAGTLDKLLHEALTRLAERKS